MSHMFNNITNIIARPYIKHCTNRNAQHKTVRPLTTWLKKKKKKSVQNVTFTNWGAILLEEGIKMFV